jgi:predicted nucleic acid-binding protein
MNCRSFPAEPLALHPSDSFYLDSSFVVAGLAREVNCTQLLSTITGHRVFISPIVWSETIHALVRTYISDDLQKAMAGQLTDLIHPEVAPAILGWLLKQHANSGGFWVRNASHDILKAAPEGCRDMLLPYQKSATTVLDQFRVNSGAIMLTIDDNALVKAQQICAETPCDTNDALHLATAFWSGCSHAVTKDADWAKVPAGLRPIVLRVA